jgi:hypothetical protein
MWLEAIYNCTHLGGDPNHSIYQIGDRVAVYESQLYIEKEWPPSGSKKEGFVVINDLIFDLSAFEVVDIAKERDEKIKKILE